ncbi:hypothetical protein [Falsirhodobacter sp. 20TX0035]|uniref:hypothetical protein n=1 Tax=Falsirhodobacter sp. 20TX0035 TaxID=3022019 RepID=UPI00232CB826|nr:hypothetical protein [Falsirhodobacter sp. 20TX0035]MDB6454693.1 hypothetical protein [Falsirhodobacter sp. 20TX0035]
MDLADFDLTAAADRGADMQLEHPVTGEPLVTDTGEEITIRLLGNDSREFRAALSDLAEKQAGKKRQSLAAAEAHSVDLLARLTLGWQGIVYKGVPLEFTRENAAMLYRERPFIREQIDRFIGNRGNFFGNGKPA